MQQNKKIIIGIVVVAVILIGGYFGYGYYLKYKKSTETAKEAIIEKELTREEKIDEFTAVLPREEIEKIVKRNLPEPNTRALSVEEKQKILKRQ